MYFIPSDVHLKDAKGFAYWDSLTAGATSGADSEAAKMVEMCDQNGGDVKVKKARMLQR